MRPSNLQQTNQTRDFTPARARIDQNNKSADIQMKSEEEEEEEEEEVPPAAAAFSPAASHRCDLMMGRWNQKYSSIFQLGCR